MGAREKEERRRHESIIYTNSWTRQCFLGTLKLFGAKLVLILAMLAHVFCICTTTSTTRECGRGLIHLFDLCRSRDELARGGREGRRRDGTRAAADNMSFGSE